MMYNYSTADPSALSAISANVVLYGQMNTDRRTGDMFDKALQIFFSIKMLQILVAVLRDL